MDQRAKAAKVLADNGYRRGGKVGRRTRAAAPAAQMQPIPTEAMPQQQIPVAPEQGIGFKRGGRCR